MQEIWKDVVGLEDTYQVSNLGKIRSKDRAVRGRGGSIRQVKGKEVSYMVGQSGRAFITLYISTSPGIYKRSTRAIDELMYEAFIGEIPDGYRVNFLDEDPLNLSLDNLELDYTASYKKWLKANGLDL